MRSKRLFVGTGLIAGMLALASLAWACTTPLGATVKVDPLTPTVSAGGSITAAGVAANPNKSFYLAWQPGPVSSSDNHFCMDGTSLTGAPTVTSNAAGVILPSAGTLPTSASGIIHVCYYQVGGATSTAGAIYVVS